MNTYAKFKDAVVSDDSVEPRPGYTPKTVTLVTDKEGEDHIYQVAPFELKGRDGNKYTFVCSHTIDNAGSFKVCYRLFPKSDKLPHRQDFCYVKWFA